MKDIEEVWKDIKGYEDLYQVSNLGRIKGQGIIIKPKIGCGGFYHVYLYVNKKQNIKKVHRLVADAFIPNPYNSEQVRFKDGDKTNIIYTNLYWYTGKNEISMPKRKITDMGEVWKDIVGYEDLYQVSNLGRIRSLDNLKRITKWIIASETDIYPFRFFIHYKGRIRKPQANTKGYMRVKLSKNGKIENCSVATLVANAFIDNPYHSRALRFKDGNKLNVSAENLYWYLGDKIVKVKVSNNKQVKKYVSIADAARQEHYAHETIRRYVNEHILVDGFYYIKSEVI